MEPSAQQVPPRETFFVAIDSWGKMLSLHSTRKAAIKRGKKYDGYTVLELEVDGKDLFTDVDADEEEEAEEPKSKRGKSSVE
jgi:hypothetical protein